MNRIKSLRDEAGLSQADLAKQFSVAQNTVSSWENGKRDPDTDTVIQIAAFFGVSIDYLLGATDIKKAPTSEEMSAVPEAQELHAVMENLSPEDRQRLLAFGRGLAATAQNPEEKK